MAGQHRRPALISEAPSKLCRRACEGYAAHAYAERLWMLAAGLVCALLLALYGLRKTRFEPTPQGPFYEPHAHLGIALSLIFLGRVLYRLIEVYMADPPAARGTVDFASSPLTLATFGLLAGYYIGYAMGLLRWRNRVLEAKRAREAKAADG